MVVCKPFCLKCVRNPPCAHVPSRETPLRNYAHISGKWLSRYHSCLYYTTHTHQNTPTCNTLISTLVWPSAAVEKTSDLEVGRVVLRVMSLVATPPNVSRPRDRGVTSSSTMSLTSPDSTPVRDIQEAQTAKICEGRSEAQTAKTCEGRSEAQTAKICEGHSEAQTINLYEGRSRGTDGRNCEGRLEAQTAIGVRCCLCLQMPITD